MNYNDLIKRLKDEQPVTQDFESTMKCGLMDEAAQAIRDLQAQNAKLREALGKFADDRNWFDAQDNGEGPWVPAWRGEVAPEEIALAALEDTK